MPRVITVSKPSTNAYLSLIASIVSLALILFGAVGLLLVQKPLLQDSQDIRGNASVADGKVMITSAYSGTMTNGDHALTLNANTQNLNVDRFELVFHVVTQTFSEAPRIILQPNTNLQLTKTEIEKTTDGFLISVVAVPQNSGNSFTSNGEKGLIQLVFYPTRSGTLVLDVDAEKSLAKTIGTGGNGDQLRPMAAATYTVSRSTATSSFKQCNESCTANSQCAAGFRCFENRCRLATHPTSSSCDVPDDQGLNRQCNEYCADTRECGAGFTCFFNRCRRPGNPDSTTCAAPVAAVQQNITRSCNQACTSNAQCAVNLRCFQGACRLATNVSSTSCSPTTTKIVSEMYYPAVGGTSNPSKGQPAPADIDDVIPPGTGSGTRAGSGTNGTGTTRPAVSPSPSTRPATGTGSTTATRSGGVATPSGTTSPFVITSSPAPSPLSSPVVTPLPEGLASGQTSTWPLLALAAGIGLLLLVIVLALVNIFRRRRSSTPTPAAGNAQAYEADLQAKINSLRQQGTQPGAAAPARPTQPIQPARPFAPPAPVVPARPAAPLVPVRPAQPPAPVSTTRPPAPVVQPNRQIMPATPLTRPPQNAPLPNRPAPSTLPIQPRRPATTQMPARPIASTSSSMQNMQSSRPAMPQAQNQPARPAPAQTNQPTPPSQPAPRPQPPASSMMARLKQKGVAVPGDSSH